MGEAEAKKRRIFAALGILWATVAAATSTGEQISLQTKEGSVFFMVIISIPPQAECGQNDHREDASHFI